MNHDNDRAKLDDNTGKERYKSKLKIHRSFSRTHSFDGLRLLLTMQTKRNPYETGNVSFVFLSYFYNGLLL